VIQVAEVIDVRVVGRFVSVKDQLRSIELEPLTINLQLVPINQLFADCARWRAFFDIIHCSRRAM